ncbi:MAG: hypothetical protein ACXW3E_04520 [Thermoanaerobaculia bacterium]
MFLRTLQCALEICLPGREDQYLSGNQTGVAGSHTLALPIGPHKAFSFKSLQPRNALDCTLRLWIGMNVERTVAAIITSALLFVAPLSAESVTAPMTVSVQVLARAVVSVDAAPASIEVTAEDIRRGYVDVAAPIRVRVRTNSRRGYLLQVDNVSEAFSTVELTMANASMNVAHESWIQRPFVSGGDLMNVQARLRLSPGARPGSHALPIAFSASPL